MKITSRFLLLLGLLLAALPLRAASESEPPKDIRLQETSFERLSDKTLSPRGEQALAIERDKWRHAETDHFIIHYRRTTEAQRAVREIEFSLWYTARLLNAGKERYARKSHVYIFSGTKEWKTFLLEAKAPEWSISFAVGDELFLNIGGIREEFNSKTLAHETAHAVVARLYPEHRWPLWLNEGLAEYVGSASIAARKNQRAKRHQNRLTDSNLPLEQLFSLDTYPKEQLAIQRLYETSERLVRFLMSEFPQERFPQFVDAIVLHGKAFEAAVMEVYKDKVTDYADFLKRYDRSDPTKP